MSSIDLKLYKSSKSFTNTVNTQTTITNTGGSLLSANTYISGSLTSTGTPTYHSNGVYYGTFGYSNSQIEIELLGQKFQIYPDSFLQTYLAQIDYFGIEYWQSMKKMSLKISDENIQVFLDKKLKSWKRQQKIKKITDES